jgi:pSer/pThr/pTyr-binding forkhead associated (FHA) protein
MGKLTLKFGDRILREVPLGDSPITIGRALDSDITIDNPVASHNHARIYYEDQQLVIEDLGSANGTTINGRPVTKEALKNGDNITIGKHTIVVDEKRDVAIFDKTRKITAPRLQETFVVGTKKRGGAAAAAAAVEDVPAPAPTRTRVPSLVVVRGKTDQSEYLLSVKLTVIGKSPMATIRMRGWFAPEVAAQINRRADGYYLFGGGGRAPKLNGEPVTRVVRLNDGDRIELRKLTLEFVDRD